MHAPLLGIGQSEQASEREKGEEQLDDADVMLCMIHLKIDN